ncbi:hypothetical protein RclHR1_04530018 [Rhizophagus clarus]|uniref:Uncharacterized protein n=1 Tax=Rhizophagus clarus TaxID=94130 RepID=A0A2Z6RI75_9GLOM|nr:hypothetical protein RclHR1_04530018 [Rhizophagus clarus]
MDAFLESEYKRKVSDEIKQRNKEKKLLRESGIGKYTGGPTQGHTGNGHTEAYSNFISNYIKIQKYPMFKPTKSHSEDVKTVTKCHDRSTLRKSEKIGKTTNGGQTNAFIPLKAEVSISTNVLSGSHSNSTYDHTYFRNKILDQYPNLYKEFSSKNFDYYGVTEETSCPLCKLKHDNEESIEGTYKAGSYFIKCEQCEIEIVAWSGHFVTTLAN